jgi:hypothetical protein
MTERMHTPASRWPRAIRAVSLLAACLCLFPALAGAGDLGLKAGILDYGQSSPQLLDWMEQRIQLKVGGVRPTHPGIRWVTYFNVQGVGSPKDMLSLKDFARQNQFQAEDMLLHATRDYTAKINPAYRGMDRFGVFEGKNGVLVGSGPRLEDRTAVAYKGEMRLGPDVYLGYEEPFAEVNWRVARSAPGTKVDCAYWDGKAWRNLAVKDETGGLAHDGRMDFVPPGDWARTSVNGSRPKYFLKLRVDGGANVVTRAIFGEAWTNGAENACRGWDGKAPGVINTGELAFNPNPPAQATARFRYQARIGFWGANASVANLGDVQRGQRPWPAYAAQHILDMTEGGGQTGIMCDDARARPTVDLALTDFAGDVSAWDAAMEESNREILKRIHAARPGFEVGSNIAKRDLLFESDWGLIEYQSFAWQTGSPRGILHADGGSIHACYDDFLPGNNPRNVFGLMMYADVNDMLPSQKIPWDRSNRGPISALSKHYIAMNENTFFSYHTKGGFIYDERDDIILKNGKVLHQSRDPLPPLAEVKRWGQWFPAMGVALGGPDPSGHKHGNYDLEWKSEKEMGDRSPIWRRDYVKAVVLNRPAFYNTPAEAYERYGPEVDLGGSFYPLRADGSTGPAVTRLALRAGEGAILMRVPLMPGGLPAKK